MWQKRLCVRSTRRSDSSKDKISCNDFRKGGTVSKRNVFVLLLSVLLLLSLWRFMPAPAQAATSSEIAEQIDELKEKELALIQQMKDLENKLSENATAMEEAVAKKDVLDQQITLLYSQVVNINEQISAYRVLIADKQEDLDAAIANQEALQEKHKQRIRTMEERGSISYWSIVFRANSLSDLLDRLNMVREIAAADKRHLEDLRQATAAVRVVKQELENQQAALEQTKKKLDETMLELEQKRQEADALLQELVQREEEYEKLLAESERLQDELMEELAKKKSEYDAAAYQEWLATSVPAETAGPDDPPAPPPPTTEGWICPLHSYTLTSPFGMRFHPILQIWRMHNGIDMAAPANTPIYATRGGMVTIASYQENGAGYYVQIDHGDEYRSIYMHMTRYIVESGQYVAPGQVIGYVGSTGLSEGNHLHFGISYAGVYVNPIQFINQ